METNNLFVAQIFWALPQRAETFPTKFLCVYIIHFDWLIQWCVCWGVSVTGESIQEKLGLFLPPDCTAFVKADWRSEAFPQSTSVSVQAGLEAAASNANCRIYALDDHRKGWQMMQLILSFTGCVRQSHRRADDCLTECVAFITTFLRRSEEARAELTCWNDPVA